MFGKRKKYAMYSEIITSAVTSSKKIVEDNRNAIKENLQKTKETMEQIDAVLKNLES